MTLTLLSTKVSVYIQLPTRAWFGNKTGPHTGLCDDASAPGDAPVDMLLRSTAHGRSPGSHDNLCRQHKAMSAAVVVNMTPAEGLKVGRRLIFSSTRFGPSAFSSLIVDDLYTPRKKPRRAHYSSSRPRDLN